jgi:hypothetical protein
VWGYDGGSGVCGGAARAWPAACRVARRGGPVPALAAFPVPGRSSLWTASCFWGGVAGAGAGRRRMLRSLWWPATGAALIDVRLDVGPLPPRSSSLTVAGCRLGGFPART